MLNNFFNASRPSSSSKAPPLLYVSEHAATERIVVYDLATGLVVARHSLNHHQGATAAGAGASLPQSSMAGLSGLAFGPDTGQLYAAHAQRNELLALTPEEECETTGGSGGALLVGLGALRGRRHVRVRLEGAQEAGRSEGVRGGLEEGLAPPRVAVLHQARDGRVWV